MEQNARHVMDRELGAVPVTSFSILSERLRWPVRWPVPSLTTRGRRLCTPRSYFFNACRISFHTYPVALESPLDGSHVLDALSYCIPDCVQELCGHSTFRNSCQLTTEHRVDACGSVALFVRTVRSSQICAQQVTGTCLLRLLEYWRKSLNRNQFGERTTAAGARFFDKSNDRGGFSLDTHSLSAFESLQRELPSD